MINDVESLVHGKTWEEMEVGSAFRTASRTVTETDLVNFITLFGLCRLNTGWYPSGSSSRCSDYAD